MAEINYESYKASGIYFIEVYDNETYTFPLVSGRLLIGSSRIGPMNAAVSLADPQEKNRTYGNGDAYLENRGSFFHQSLDTALLEGPVFGLNIVPVDLLDDDSDDNGYVNKDRGNYSYFNLEPATVTSGTTFSHIGADPSYPQTSPIKDFYNRQRFWAATPEKLTAVKDAENSGVLAANSMFSVVNLSKKPVTIFMHKANVIGYDMTVQEWYSIRFENPSIPSFLHPDDIIEDYFVDVIVIEGDWTNYHQLAGDAIYGQYFDKNGLIVDEINDFLQLSTVKMINRSIGSLIPDFQDAGGNVVSVDRLFNNYYPTTEMIIGLDVDKMEDVDLTVSDFNSSVESISSYRIDTVGHGLYDEDNNTTADVGDDNLTFNLDDDINTVIDYLSYKSPTSSLFKYNLTAVASWDLAQLHQVLYISTDTDVTTIRAYQNSNLYKAWQMGFIKNGVHLLDAGYATPGSGTAPTTVTYLKVTGPSVTNDTVPLTYITLTAYTDVSLTQASNFTASNDAILTNLAIFMDNTDLSEHSAYIDTIDSPVYEDGILHIPTSNISDVTLFEEYVQAGNYIKAKVLEGRRRVMKILSVTKTLETPGVTAPTSIVATGSTSGGTLAADDYFYTVAAFDGTYWSNVGTEDTETTTGATGSVAITWAEVSGAVKYRIYKGTVTGTYDTYEEVEGALTVTDTGSNFATAAPATIPAPPYTTYHIEIQPTYGGGVDGVDIDADGTGNNTSLLIQKNIQDYVTALTGVYLPAFKLREQVMPNGSALRQQEIMKFVFDSGLSKAISDVETLDVRYIVDTYQGEITANSKYYWGLLGAHHGKTLVFVNDPSMKQFEENNDPTFIDASTGLIDAQYIVDGGNTSLNPSYLYSLPNYSYNGTPIGTYMYFVGPNLIIRRNGKTLSVPPAVYSSNVYIRRNKSGNKYGIPAVKRGLISEPEVIGVEYTYNNEERGLMETNGHNIIVRKRRVGTMIFTDNTAYYRVQSPLNSANNRDLLVTLEKAIDLILFNYLYDYNDAVIQIRIKAAIGHYLNSIVAGGGLSFAEVTMDSTNNTKEVIKQNVGLIDIRIGFKYGIHKFINRISFSEQESGLSANSSGFKLL